MSRFDRVNGGELRDTSGATHLNLYSNGHEVD